MTVCRQVFKYGNEYHSLGIQFAALYVPSAGVLRRHKAQRPQRMYSPEELRLILAESGELKPMILLALNGTLGNQDIFDLMWSHISGNWIDIPRRKTGVNRRFPLWPLTAAALGERGSGKVFNLAYSAIGERFAELANVLREVPAKDRLLHLAFDCSHGRKPDGR